MTPAQGTPPFTLSARIMDVQPNTPTQHMYTEAPGLWFFDVLAHVHACAICVETTTPGRTSGCPHTSLMRAIEFCSIKELYSLQSAPSVLQLNSVLIHSSEAYFLTRAASRFHLLHRCMTPSSFPRRRSSLKAFASLSADVSACIPDLLC